MIENTETRPLEGTNVPRRLLVRIMRRIFNRVNMPAITQDGPVFGPPPGRFLLRRHPGGAGGGNLPKGPTRDFLGRLAAAYQNGDWGSEFRFALNSSSYIIQTKQMKFMGDTQPLERTNVRRRLIVRRRLLVRIMRRIVIRALKIARSLFFVSLGAYLASKLVNKPIA
jgi:hypothetical protein